MSKLFIIGNGFDVAHKLKTTYEDFRNYLQSSHTDAFSNCEEVNYSHQDISEASDVIFELLIEAINAAEGDLWSNLEETLGAIDNESILLKNGYKNADTLLENLGTRADVFKDLFDSWVYGIDMEEVKPKQEFMSLIETGDQFLTFNYTRTLENIYKVDEEAVLHIHGEAGDKLEFGHGAGYRDTASEEEQNVHKIFRKNTADIAEEHNGFFEELPKQQIKKIYSFGFSFSEVDQIYLRIIFEKLDTSNITWLFNSHKKESIENYKGILKECGFKGEYNTFSVNL